MARTQDVWGAEGISGRVKFLPLAWAGMPKTSFRKNSDSPHFKRAVELNPDMYALKLGRILENGVITEPDSLSAFNNYELAKTKGNVRAKYRMALLLATGTKELTADVEKAQQLANEAAQSGDKDAKNLLEALI